MSGLRIAREEVASMVELRLGLQTIDLPFTVRVPNITEEMFMELADPDTKAELLDGVMTLHSPATPRHDRIGNFVRRLASDYTEEFDLGEVFGPEALIHLATCRMFAPDGFFFHQSRVPIPIPEDLFEGSPDWLFEVLSPSNRRDDLEDKRPAYQRAGVREMWFIDPLDRVVIVDRKQGKRYVTKTIKGGRVSSTVLSGFWIETQWLWADPIPKASRCFRQILKG